jgi:hypothetical protein
VPKTTVMTEDEYVELLYAIRGSKRPKEAT